MKTRKVMGDIFFYSGLAILWGGPIAARFPESQFFLKEFLISRCGLASALLEVAWGQRR